MVIEVEYVLCKHCKCQESPRSTVHKRIYKPRPRSINSSYDKDPLTSLRLDDLKNSVNHEIKNIIDRLDRCMSPRFSSETYTPNRMPNTYSNYPASYDYNNRWTSQFDEELEDLLKESNRMLSMASTLPLEDHFNPLQSYNQKYFSNIVDPYRILPAPVALPAPNFPDPSKCQPIVSYPRSSEGLPGQNSSNYIYLPETVFKRLLESNTAKPSEVIDQSTNENANDSVFKNAGEEDMVKEEKRPQATLEAGIDWDSDESNEVYVNEEDNLHDPYGKLREIELAAQVASKWWNKVQQRKANSVLDTDSECVATITNQGKLESGVKDMFSNWTSSSSENETDARVRQRQPISRLKLKKRNLRSLSSERDFPNNQIVRKTPNSHRQMTSYHTGEYSRPPDSGVLNFGNVNMFFNQQEDI